MCWAWRNSVHIRDVASSSTIAAGSKSLKICVAFYLENEWEFQLSLLRPTKYQRSLHITALGWDVSNSTEELKGPYVCTFDE